MRASMRITWLLLSLSSLCHSVCSDGPKAAPVTSAPTIVPTSSGGTKTVTDRKTTVSATNVTGATPTSSEKMQTQAPTTIKPTATPNLPATRVTATPKPADKPTPTQPQASTVTNNSPAPSTSSPEAPTTVVNGAIPPDTTPAATADSSRVSVIGPNATTVLMSGDSVPSKTSGTEMPDRLPVDRGNEGTTKITKVSTAVPTPGQQSTTHTTTNSKTGQEGSKGGTMVIRVTVPSRNTGTTSTPLTRTEAGPPAVETSGNKAGTTSPQATVTVTTTAPTTTTTTTTIAVAQPKTFLYSLNNGQEKEEEKDLGEVCRRLMANLHDGNCTLTWQHHNGKLQFDFVEINGKVKTSLANQYYEEITKKPTDNKTLIAILASCGALLIMIVILAVCASHHRKPYNENQQHLTEELHTVENGYHDNPTLEVMEVQPEMQEKKMALNGEFNDSWIVPIDNLLKEDIPDEEDTHL